MRSLDSNYSMIVLPVIKMIVETYKSGAACSCLSNGNAAHLICDGFPVHRHDMNKQWDNKWDPRLYLVLLAFESVKR